MTLLHLCARNCLNVSKVMSIFPVHKLRATQGLNWLRFLGRPAELKIFKGIFPDIPRVQYFPSTIAAACMLATQTIYTLLPQMLTAKPAKKGRSAAAATALPADLLQDLQAKAFQSAAGIWVSMVAEAKHEQQQEASTGPGQPKHWRELLQGASHAMNKMINTAPAPSGSMSSSTTCTSQQLEMLMTRYHKAKVNLPTLGTTGVALEGLMHMSSNMAAELLEGNNTTTFLNLSLLLMSETLQNSLPCYHACSCPSCTNLEGRTEKELCKKKCATCRTAYCSQECNQRNWQMHKVMCRKFNNATSS